MHEGRVSTARLRRAQLLFKLAVIGVCVAACVSGCAAEVNTLEPGDEALAGQGGTDMAVVTTGGKSASGGSSASTAGTGGSKVVNAFGGTASNGGKPAGGATSGAGTGGKAQGGSAGSGGTTEAGAASGGNKNGGAGGQAGAGGKSSGGAGSSGAAGAGNLACLASWKNDKCDTCSAQTQSDKLGCVQILDCYYANGCGPATCGGNTDKCGANVIGKGTAGYPIAQDVYTCLCK
jgi:hypothetical protein